MPAASKRSAAACPCGSDLAYSRCCAPLHRGAPALTAEALMRSRYSAYVKRLEPYLLRTWAVDTRPAQLRLDPDLHWLGLEVRRVVDGGTEHDTGTVEFVARHEHHGVMGSLHEVSRFVRSDGDWVYLDGVSD